VSETFSNVVIVVRGIPCPKQSFRVGKNGHGYTDHRQKAWQELVAVHAREAMRGREPIKDTVSMNVSFFMPTHRRVDLDNLNKGTMDGMRGIVFDDDSQVIDLHLRKCYKPSDPGVIIFVSRMAEIELPDFR